MHSVDSELFGGVVVGCQSTVFRLNCEIFLLNMAREKKNLKDIYIRQK